jgi:hypothetical protein
MNKKNSFSAPYLAHSSEINSTLSIESSASILEPIDHLNALTKRYPKAWKMIDTVRKHPIYGSKTRPAWCFAPVEAYDAVSTIYKEFENIQSITFGVVEKLAALAPWRLTKSIYEYEPSVYESIGKNELKGNIPVAVLHRIPEWSVYIKTPNFMNIDGFFAHLEYDHVRDRTQIRFLLDIENDLLPLTMHIGEWTIKEGINRFFIESAKQHDEIDCEILRKEMVDERLPVVQKCLSLLLYLCIDEPDIERIQNLLPCRPRVKKGKKNQPLIPPKHSTVWQVGKRLAKQIIIPEEAKGKSHNSPIPHIRRGHYHGVWIGKRNSPDRKFIYNWWHPTVINAAA